MATDTAGEVEARYRRDFEAARRSPVEDRQWEMLVGVGLLEDARAGTSAEELVEAYQPYLDAFRRPQRAVAGDGEIAAGPEGSRTGAQLEAVSILLAREAEDDEDLLAFRRERLDDTLLEHDEVESWITGQRKLEPPDALIETVMPPATKVARDSDGLLTVDPPIRLASGLKYLGRRPAPQLEYAVPSDEFVRRVPVQVGGLLDELRALVDRLSIRYGWQRASATTFVLTGLVPLRPGVRAQHQLTPVPAAARLELSIDLHVTPAELASRYRTIRAALRPGGARAMSTKHAVLVAFVESRSGPEPWRTRMDAWNGLWQTSRPRWVYTQVSNFQRDYGQARQRLRDGT